MCVTGVFLLNNTYHAEIAGDFGCHSMIRHSCRILASSLLLTNVESHKRAQPWTTFDGLKCIQSESCTRIDEAHDGPNSDQVQGGKRTPHVSSVFLSACGKDPVLVPSRFADTDGLIPRDAKNVAITWTNHWCSTPSGKPCEARAHQAGYMPHLPASLCHLWAQPRASGRFQWARDVTFSRRSYADPRKKP